MGYEIVGTLEFIVDTFSRDFCFVEMNTQLQVTLSSYLIYFLKTSTIMLLCNLVSCLIYSYGVFFYVF